MHVVGIDVGTYASSVAVSVNNHPTIIDDPRGGARMPSVVAIAQNGKQLVGQAAKHQAALNPENTVVGAKRLLGRSWSSTETAAVRQRARYALQPGSRNDVGIWLRDRAHSPAEICALVVDRLKRVAESYLDTIVKQCVFGVPAYFDEQQRNAMAEVGALIGLEVVELLAEPVAAALACGCGGEKTIAVYNMGATSECSILSVGSDDVQIISSAHDLFLGGEAFDYCIVDYLADVLLEENGFDLLKDPLAQQRVLDTAEGVKVSLSDAEDAMIELALIDHDERPMTRELFEELVAELVEHSVEVCRAAVERAEIRPAEVDELLLVGAQSAMPALRFAVSEYFGRTPKEGCAHPQDLVCLGLALRGEQIGGVQQTTTATFPAIAAEEPKPVLPAPPAENRRQHLRQPLVLKVDYPSRGDFLTDYTLNISQGGLNLCTEQAMTIGEQLELQLSFPNLVEALSVQTVVRWIGEGQLAGESVVGLELVGDRGALSELANRIAAQDPELIVEQRKPYILVVEEDAQLAALIEQGLDTHPPERATAVAREVQGALLLLSEGFDVLVLDLSLPNHQSVALINAVRAKPRWSSLPIVGVGIAEQREVTIAAGADFFIQRPVHLPLLVDTLKNLLQH